MNEAQTRKDLIDPAIEKAGWTKANGCQVLVEQSAVQFAPGRVGKVRGRLPIARRCASRSCARHLKDGCKYR